VHPLPADAAGRIAALDVRDLGESLARLAIRVAAKEGAALERELELGGPEPCTLAVHLAALRRRYTPRPAYRLPIPALVARATSHICDVLRATPFSFGHWELLRRDNCPRRNALPALLGRPPRAVGVGPPTNPVAGTVTDFLSKESGFGIS
jgi:NADH dehydrogenase